MIKSKTNILILLLVLPMLAMAQLEELSLFKNLADKTWIAEGNWEHGAPFKQELTLRYDLQGTLVLVNSKGFVGEQQSDSADDMEFGNRNHGVRQYDGASNTIRFWEFDFFGNVTEGIVFSEGKNIIYQYNYDGTQMTDMWEYVDDSTYNFKVGVYRSGKWEKLYLKTVFKEKK